VAAVVGRAARAAAARLRCLLYRLLGRLWGLPGACGPAAGDVSGLLERAAAARRGLEEAARKMYADERLEEAWLFEVLAEELREVEGLLAEVEYLLERLGLGEGFSEARP
jgi:hypothetical protein